jgi:phosphoglycerol transferase MdoB-like AlkP superfamily enzyme
MLEGRVSYSPHDLRGLVSDLLVALLVYACAYWLCRRSRAGGALLVMAWCLLNIGNYEHIATLGASADIRNVAYLFDPTFFLGSVLSPSSPGLALAVGGITAGLLLVSFRLPQKKTAVWPVAAAGALGLLILLLVPLSSSLLSWRQANFVDENLHQLFGNNSESSLASMSAVDRERLQALYARDLSGIPIVEPSGGKPNVLLLILEGISGVHLESLARVHGVGGTIAMPELDLIAKSNLSYSTFISHNRQTNRGEYAILCGDMPALVNAEPKMTQALSAQDIDCLPSVLRRAGYTTVYLQAAPIGFMSKDSFMPRAGFDEVHGEQWFRRSYARNQWGIDDLAFLQQSTARIARLQKEGSPWFLTLLTVGTHHPYIVPGEYGAPTFPDAARYLDTAVAQFIEKISAMGVLEDTLIIITSDESVGITGYRGSAAHTEERRPDDVTDKLADIWGLLIAITPERDNRRVDEAFAQIDIATSILDYLGLAGVSNSFIGRSVFRRYDSGRPIAFGNLYKKFVGVVDAKGFLHFCSQELYAGCEHYVPPESALFSPLREPGVADPDAVALLASVVAASADPALMEQVYSEQRPATRTMAITHDPLVRVRDTPGTYVLFGGQYLTTAPHSKISVEMDVVLQGSPGSLQLAILLQSDQGKHFSRRMPRQDTGDRVRLVFDYYATEALESLALIGTVTTLSGEGMVLNFEKATLRITEVQASNRQNASGLSLQSMEVSPQ